MKKLFFLTVVISLFCASCTYTSTSTKFPEINDEETLAASIDSLVPNSGRM
ncbi:MAG: hypothetical protein V4604_10355 [Bacteroidota bacterium]